MKERQIIGGWEVGSLRGQQSKIRFIHESVPDLETKLAGEEEIRHASDSG